MQNIGGKLHQMSSNKPKQWSCATPNLSACILSVLDKCVANFSTCINSKYYFVSSLHMYIPLWPQKTGGKFDMKRSWHAKPCQHVCKLTYLAQFHMLKSRFAENFSLHLG